MKSILPVLFALSILLAACGKPAEKDDGKLHIYTTLYPLQYFTERIGGKHVTAESIIPPGADAHTFEPSTKTMVKLTEGDAFIYNKWGTDEFSSSVADTLKNEDVPVINAAKGVEYKHEEEHKKDEHGSDGHSHEESGLDPHIWLDPVLSQQMAENIMNSLVKQKPSAKKDFEKNFAALENDLQELDRSFKELSSSPNKTFVVSHAAYGYWAERYGLEQMSISGLSPSHEPSQKQVKNIIHYVKEEKVSYILFEENVNNSVAESIKRETGAGTLTLHNLETLTKEDIKLKRDYLSIMNDNVKTLKKALK